MREGTILKFSGHSDDVIEVERIDPHLQKVSSDEITASPTSDITRILVQNIGGTRGVYVFAMYDGCWHFSVRQLDESRKIPHQWEITISQDANVADYSALLIIDATRPNGDVLDKPVRIDHDHHLPRGSS